MTGGRSIAATAAVAFLAAAVAAAAVGAASGGRLPPGNVELAGFFDRAAWQGTVSIRIASDGARVSRMSGILPGVCREKQTGRVVRAGRDGAIGMQFDAFPNAVIRPNGTFSFTAKVSAESGLAPHTVTVRGTFYGNNALGRVSGRSTAAKYDRYSSCSGDQPFWAKRID
jgi:opacity protein-like surface antigen